MNKKLMFILAVVLVLVLALPVFVACNDTEKVTVTWYDGTKVLRTEEVEKGTVLTSWTPTTDDGRVFQEWYAETSKTTKFDFTKAINEDTDIFAGFKAAFTVDDRTWCLIGAGAGTLKDSAWSVDAAVEETLKLTKTDDTDVNKFVMENVLLYAGDEFQIRIMGTWDNQHGVGYIDGYTTLAEPEGNVVGVVEKDGTRYFQATGGIGDSAGGWNAVVVESGVYTLTLETTPGSAAYDKIFFEKTGEAPKIEVTHDMYITGTNNEWKGKDAEGSILMTQSQDRATWTAVVTVTEDMYADWTVNESPNKELCAAFKVKNEISGKDYGVDGGMDNFYLTVGTYIFKYTVATNKVEVQECKYYFIGTFLDGETAVNYSIKVGVTPELTVEGTTATGTLVATDVTSNSNFSWIKKEGKTDASGAQAVFAFKIVFGCELGVVGNEITAEGGDNFYVQAGTYTVTLNTETLEVTITPADQPQA